MIFVYIAAGVAAALMIYLLISSANRPAGSAHYNTAREIMNAVAVIENTRRSHQYWNGSIDSININVKSHGSGGYKVVVSLSLREADDPHISTTSSIIGNWYNDAWPKDTAYHFQIDQTYRSGGRNCCTLVYSARECENLSAEAAQGILAEVRRLLHDEYPEYSVHDGLDCLFIEIRTHSA